MKYIGEHVGRKIFWLDINSITPDQLPDKNWICLAITNTTPNPGLCNNFLNTSFQKNILEFKWYGTYGKQLHELCSNSIAIMKMKKKHKEINVLNSWHQDQPLTDVFWQCFFTTDSAKMENQESINIVCIDFDGINRIEELKSYLKDFESGWFPTDYIKHEIWEDTAGLTTLCNTLNEEDESRQPLEPGSKLIYSFYASTRFEAMTRYYKFMNWGEYKLDLYVDEKLYDMKTPSHNELQAKRSEIFSDQLRKKI